MNNNNFDFEKLYRKPIFPANNDLNFNRLGFKINNHPIVILELEQDIVFLTAQGAYYKPGSLELDDVYLKEKINKNEMFLLKKTNELNAKNNGLFQKDSLIDTTSLFVMNKEDFCKCYNINNKNLYATRKIDMLNWKNILNQVMTNFKSNNITINKIISKKNDKGEIILTETELLYSNQELLNKDLEHCKKLLSKSDINNINNKITKLLNNSDIKNLICKNLESECLSINYELYNSVLPNLDGYDFYSYNSNNEISCSNLFNLPTDYCIESDFEKNLEIESFSDYEKDYYKEHPEEFNDKYETYLEKLKQEYVLYQQKSAEKERSNMLELFKPLLILKDKDNPVIFDEFGEKYNDYHKKYDNFDLNKQIENNHPFIIFYDDNQDCYYYLKAKGTTHYKEKTGEYVLRKKRPSEIIVRESHDDGLFKENVYVDCSQIFKCDRELLESLIDVDHDYYKNSKSLRNFDVVNILDKINEFCNEVPPNLSIIEVDLDEAGNTYGKSIYLSDQKIDDFYSYLDSASLYLNDYGDELIASCVSSCDSDYKQCRDRYENAIAFVKMFQKEYFYEEYAKTDYDQKYCEPFKHKEPEREW